MDLRHTRTLVTVAEAFCDMLAGHVRKVSDHLIDLTRRACKVTTSAEMP